ncbi:MAG TPA: hypothetical protein VMI54_28715 [Polyangiaceae bacterium]|nr:hypothetical protein [Polyangiaceae bacterium]
MALAASALLAWLPAERCFAQTATFDVPPECGDELAFRSELVRLTGNDAARARPSRLRITHEAERGTYRLTLDVGGRTRELEHADCRVLLRSAAVIAAASLKAEAVPAPAAVSTPVTPRAAAAPAPATAPLERDATQRAEHGTRDREWRGNVAAGVGLAAGVVPDVTAAFEVRGEVLGELAGASLGVRYFPTRSAAVEGRRADVWGVGLRGAAVVRPVPALNLSLGLDADRLSGRGSGVTKPERDSAWTLAPSAELAIIPIRNRHLSLEVAAEGRLALVRPVFVVTGFQDLYRVPSWGMVLVLRGAWHFP